MAFAIIACGPNVQTFKIRGDKIQDGRVTITDEKLVEFDGRVIGEPDAQFQMFSQDEGVGTESPMAEMMCNVNSIDSTGNASVKCSYESRIRQNALVLVFSDNSSERTEYRPNIIDNNPEHAADLDYRFKELGVQPTTVPNTLKIFKEFGLKIKINSDYQYTNPDDVETYWAPTRGFYLTFTTEISCYGKYTNNSIDLHRWNGSGWDFVERYPLENVDFDHSSGDHPFNVEGNTIILHYSHHYECNDQSEWIK